MTESKKKAQAKVPDGAVEAKSIDVSDGLVSYRGKATVEFMRGSRTYRSYRVKNQGCLPLFKFLSLCMVESFDSRLAPYGIRLFNIDYGDMSTTSISSQFTSDNQTTTTIVPKSSVEVNVDEASAEVTATLTFVIPFTVLPNESKSTVIAIYSRNDAEKLSSPMAFIRLAAKTEDGGWKEAPSQTIVGDGKSNIKIRWSMEVADGSGNN